MEAVQLVVTNAPPLHPALPQNIEAEKATLGSILLNREAIIAVAAWLRPEYFYLERHAWIYESMLACYHARIPPDTHTVSEDLRRRDRLDQIGGIIYLSDLVDSVPTSYHIEYYARIVQRTALLRLLISAGGKIAAIGYDERGGDLEVAFTEAEQTLYAVTERRSTKDFVPIAEVVDEYYEFVQAMQEGRGEALGLKSGFRDLDDLLGGLHRSDLIIMAARPSVGKTSWVLSVAYQVALVGQATVGIFSLEMSREQLLQRLIAMDTGIDTHRLRTGQLRESELQTVMDAMGRLAAAPIYIEDTPGESIANVRSKARRLKSTVGCDLIIVDYIQLVAGGRNHDNRVQEVGDISRGLKALARELNVPVLAISQLSRAVEARASHVPMLSDLRESGCLSGETLVYLPDDGVYCRIDQLVRRSGFNVLALDTETRQFEPRPVLRAFATGTKPVYLMSTGLGRSIRGTANHKFLTIHGWKRLDELAPGMRLALPRGLPVSSHAAMGDARLALLSDRCESRATFFSQRIDDHAGGIGKQAIQCAAQTLVAPPFPDGEGSDVYWDEIVAINSDGEAEVYDLTVEGLHNFVADGLVVHNSLEQDADIVMFLYREELYDRETDKKGIAELHVAKHRNGPIGVVPMRFDASTTRFLDLTYRVLED